MLKCSAAWPRTLANKKINLQIKSADGSIDKVQLTGDDEFLLHLEVLESRSTTHTAWVIETRQFFVPSKTLKRSRDGRKLSFRVDQCSVD